MPPSHFHRIFHKKESSPRDQPHLAKRKCSNCGPCSVMYLRIFSVQVWCHVGKNHSQMVYGLNQMYLPSLLYFYGICRQKGHIHYIYGIHNWKATVKRPCFCQSRRLSTVWLMIVVVLFQPITPGSMYGILTYISHKN